MVATTVTSPGTNCLCGHPLHIMCCLCHCPDCTGSKPGVVHCPICNHAKDDCYTFGSDCACCCGIHCAICPCKDENACWKANHCGCCRGVRVSHLPRDPVFAEWSAGLSKLDTSQSLDSICGAPDILVRLIELYILADYAADFTDPRSAKILSLWRTRAYTLANQLGNYLVMSCTGEARHIESVTGDARQLTPRGEAWIIGQQHNFSRKIVLREQVYAGVTKYIVEGGDRLALLDAVYDVFTGLSWRPGMGGIKWAKGAALGASYFAGTLTPVMFIDMLLGMVHNGGLIINKYYHMVVSTTHGQRLDFQRFLDLKRENVRCLMGYYLPSPEFEALFSQELQQSQGRISIDPLWKPTVKGDV